MREGCTVVKILPLGWKFGALRVYREAVNEWSPASDNFFYYNITANNSTWHYAVFF